MGMVGMSIASRAGLAENALAGRVALVTGAASGIGWATARLLAGLGAVVVALDRDAATLSAAKQATPQERERASAVTAAERLYDPADVARTLVLLASDDAATITGASIAIDHATTAGGWASQWVHQMIARPSVTG
jgi:NAD(P)-dependent dehydrogenase (short-subunit alcohol dehydrogenase family)